MNRPGQPQQRPPSLAPGPGLASQYRPPYPNYGMPPRNVNVLQGGGYVPSLQQNTHRTVSQQAQAQNMLPQQTSNFIQQRGQSSFAFGGGLGQHQQTVALQQQPQPPSQTNGNSNSLPPHLAQTPSLAATPSVSSASEVGLDPNDFPALGSTPANNHSSGSNGGNAGGSTTASYATQAGTGVQPGGGAGTGVGAIGGGVGGGGNASQPRDFTPDDFPALGGQSQTPGQNPSQNQNSSQDDRAHPPGLNGFQHTDHSQQQQHRQNILGALSGGLQQGTPGMLNLAPTQARSVHPGFQQGQTEAEKQQQRSNYALKLNQATHAAWNSPNTNPSTQSQSGQQQNGSHSTQNSSATHPNAPPGVPPLATSYTQLQQPSVHTPGAITNAAAPSVPPLYASNGLAQGDSLVTSSNPNPNSTNPHPQTPAQQILMSAADRWGLLGLLAMIKNAGTDVDQGLSSVGTDLGTMGLDMGFTGNLYSTFITPWSDQSAAHTVEPDYHLPGCYVSVQAPPPGPTKATAFSDETLFFMFYSSPRDALQEVAAQELWNRNWRYHKERRLWITKESGTSPSQKVQGGEQGQYTFWDPENWNKEQKDMTVLYADLEEKNVPAFLPGPGLVPAQGAQGQGQATGQQTQVQAQSQVQSTQRGTYQMGLGL